MEIEKERQRLVGKITAKNGNMDAEADAVPCNGTCDGSCDRGEVPGVEPEPHICDGGPEKNRKHVIAISGKRLSGKDFAADSIIDAGYRRIKYADSIYSELTTLGFTQDDIATHKEVLRPIMIAIGDARRFFDEDHYARQIWGDLNHKESRFVITDLRFRNEARILREWEAKTGNRVTMVRLERPDFKRDQKADSHKSECDLDHWTDWDLIVNANSGETEKLVNAATLAMKMGK